MILLEINIFSSIKKDLKILRSLILIFIDHISRINTHILSKIYIDAISGQGKHPLMGASGIAYMIDARNYHVNLTLYVITIFNIKSSKNYIRYYCTKNL